MCLYEFLNICNVVSKICILPIYSSNTIFNGYCMDFLFDKNKEKYSFYLNSLVRNVYCEENTLYIIIS